MVESKEEFEGIHIDIRSKFSKVRFIVLMVINIAVIAFIDLPAVRNGILFFVGWILWALIAAVQIRYCSTYVKPESETREYGKLKFYIAAVIVVKVIITLLVTLNFLRDRLIYFNGMVIGDNMAEFICFLIGALPILIIAVVKMVYFGCLILRIFMRLMDWNRYIIKWRSRYWRKCCLKLDIIQLNVRNVCCQTGKS